MVLLELLANSMLNQHQMINSPNISRLEAIKLIRAGLELTLQYQGLFTTFTITLLFLKSMKRTMAFLACPVMQRTYQIRLSTKQVLSYIKRHYPRHLPGLHYVSQFPVKSR